MNEPLKLSPMKSIVDVARAALKEVEGCLWNCQTALEGRASTIAELEEEKKVLLLQVDGLKKDLAHWKDCHGATADKLEESNRLNDELLRTLGSAIQYVEHSSIGHKRNEDTLEIRHDETCFKCKALKTYFAAEEKQTEKRNCGIPVTVPGLRCKNGGCDELSACGGCFGCKNPCYLAL